MTFEQNPPFTPAAETAPYVPQPSGTVTQRAGLGITALAIAIPVFVLSIVASVLVGIAAGQIAPIGAGSGSFSDGFADSYAAGSAPENAALGVAVLAHITLGSLLGGAALVIGIIAIALKRGRGQGIAAVIVAGTAPIVSFIVYSVVAGVVAATRVL